MGFNSALKRLRMGTAIFVLTHTPLFRVEELFVVALILSFRLCLGPPSGLFAVDFPIKTLQAFTFPPYVRDEHRDKIYIFDMK